MSKLLTVLLSLSFSLNSYADCLGVFEKIDDSIEPVPKVLFRNNPLVIGRPTLLSALFEEILTNPNKEAFNDQFTKFLDNLDLDASAIVNNKIVSKPRKIDKNTERLIKLFHDVSRIVPDQISWGQMVRGKEAILAHLARRETKIAEMKSEVQKVLNKVDSDWRPGVFLSIGVDIGQMYFIPPTIILWTAFYAFNSEGLSSYRQLGVLPVNWGKDDYYDSDFLTNSREIKNQLKLEVKKDSRFYQSREFRITYSHLKQMKDCNLLSSEELKQGTVDSCVLARPTGILDLISRGTRNNIGQHYKAITTEPRWYAPKAAIDEMLVYDNETNEPILMTFLRLFAEKQEGKKKKDDKKEAEEKKLNENPGYQPAPIRY